MSILTPSISTTSPIISTSLKRRSTKDRLTPEQLREIYLLRSQQVSCRDIAAQLGCTERGVYRVLKRAPRQSIVEAAKTLGVTRKELREEQKEVLMKHFRESTERVCEWVNRLIKDGDDRAFERVMQGLDKMNRIAGDSVGEHAPLAAQPPVIHVDIKLLLARILDKPTNGGGPGT